MDNAYQLILNSPIGIVVLSNQAIIFVNTRFLNIIGAADKQFLINKSFMDYVHPSYHSYFSDWLQKISSSDANATSLEIIMIKNNGSSINVEVFGNTYNEKGEIQILIHDITERKKIETDMLFLVDGKTDDISINTELISSSINNGILAAEKNKHYLAVMRLDLDQFKLINESYGHRISDLLLQSVMQRFKKIASPTENIFTLGNDQFIIVIQAIESINQINSLARKYFNALSYPFLIDANEINTNATAGISIYPENGVDSETLLKNADLAHHLAKKSGKNNFMFFTPSMAHHIKKQTDILYDLKHALKNEEFSLLYQPVINIANGSVVNLEALLRWNRLKKEMVMPSQFLPLAEETGLIFDISDWVIRTASEQNFIWKRQGLNFLPISINLSMRQFHAASGLIESVQFALQKIQMPASCLEFEMSENVTVLDIGSDIIRALKNMQIKLTIDDFGAAYFSLNELKRYQIDNIKIDRSLIKAIPAQDDETAIVNAIIAMGRELGINVYAEGVEFQEQLHFLDNRGCYKMQGNYICPPVTAEQLLPMLKNEEPFPFQKAWASVSY